MRERVRIALLPTGVLWHACLGGQPQQSLLCSRNYLGQTIVNGCSEATDSAVRLSLVLAQAHDSELFDACCYGLRWEVLSHRIEQEEKGCVLCSQAALSDLADATMLAHGMQIRCRS